MDTAPNPTCVVQAFRPAWPGEPKGPHYVRKVYQVCACLLIAGPVAAQSTESTRLAIIQAESRGAESSADFSVIKNATFSRDIDTARMAVRAIGRLERPARIPDILPLLRHALPEVRAEAANAIAQAAQGFRGLKRPVATNLVATQAALTARLNVEEDPQVRGALCEAIARLPYDKADDVDRAEAAIIGLAASGTTRVPDRVGVAKGLEALVRMQRSIRPASEQAIGLLKSFIRDAAARSGPELLRDARVRRLALEGLTSANALDGAIIENAAVDPDPQVRRLAMRGAALSGAGMAVVVNGLTDVSPLVRLEALRTLRSRRAPETCEASIKASFDADMNVALIALDQLGSCGESPAAVNLLEQTVADRSELSVPRRWHRNAHALVALALAAPEPAATVLDAYASSSPWQVRLYAARAAAQLKNRTVLERLAGDADQRVAETARNRLDAAARAASPHAELDVPAPTAADLRRLAAARAVVTIRDVGRFELALLTAEAPSTVMRFAQLAEMGYYNGLTFDRIAPNAIVQGGRRLTESARYPNSEVGTWPHVRGVVGLSMPDTDDAQFFVNLVDNPRFDHQYTVFAQVLNGADIIDQLLEGDVIESIDIVP